MFRKHTTKLSEGMAARVKVVRDLLANTQTIPVELSGKTYRVEYLVIPAVSEKGESLTPIFNYPGGGTALPPCIEPFVYMDRESVTISPLGYGKSSDPDPSIWNDPLHGADVGLQVLQALGVKRVVLYGHSNAAPVVLEMARRAKEFGIEIEEIKLVNPIGLRRLPVVWPALAYPIFGGLARLLSLFRKHPYKLFWDAYPKIQHPFSVWRYWLNIRRTWYELTKSSTGLLPNLLWKIRQQRLKIPFKVVQSRWDWGRLHMPWTMSNEEIFQEYTLAGTLEFILLSGLHNVTLGKDSRRLAEVLEKSFWTSLILLAIFMPYTAAIYQCIL